jgi:hypothetical protein
MIGDNCAYERSISASNRLSICILGVGINKEHLFSVSTYN